MIDATSHQYLIALGSNRRHMRHGRPRQVLKAALIELNERDCTVEAISKIHTTSAIGPSDRQFANAAAIITTSLAPDALLAMLKCLERDFGVRRGQRWSARVLDLDIILWSGGEWQTGRTSGTNRALSIPHPAFRARSFVTQPASEIASDWRDPVSGLTVHQIMVREKTNKPA